MRYSIARFPFIISFQERNPGGDARDMETLSFFEKPGEELKILIRNNEEKLSSILKKMVFLESSLDEILEKESLENVIEHSTSLLEEEKQKMEKFFLGLIQLNSILLYLYRDL